MSSFSSPGRKNKLDLRNRPQGIENAIYFADGVGGADAHAAHTGVFFPAARAGLHGNSGAAYTNAESPGRNRARCRAALPDDCNDDAICGAAAHDEADRRRAAQPDHGVPDIGTVIDDSNCDRQVYRAYRFPALDHSYHHVNAAVTVARRET
jgi:hypothetical protein